MATPKKNEDERPSWLSYQALLETDTHPVPDVLRRSNPIKSGPSEIFIDRYLSRDFFDLEVERLWKRVWQMACREEDIPNVGDNIVYDIAGMSFVVVRTTPDAFKAFYNACLHRGRLLREAGSFRATEFRCPFHGFAWNIDGTLKHVPCQWIFPTFDRRSGLCPKLESRDGAGSFLLILISKPNRLKISSERS